MAGQQYCQLGGEHTLAISMILPLLLDTSLLEDTLLKRKRMTSEMQNNADQCPQLVELAPWCEQSMYTSMLYMLVDLICNCRTLCYLLFADILFMSEFGPINTKTPSLAR